MQLSRIYYIVLLEVELKIVDQSLKKTYTGCLKNSNKSKCKESLNIYDKSDVYKSLNNGQINLHSK